MRLDFPSYDLSLSFFIVQNYEWHQRGARKSRRGRDQHFFYPSSQSSEMCSLSHAWHSFLAQGSQTLLPLEGLHLCKVPTYYRETAGDRRTCCLTETAEKRSWVEGKISKRTGKRPVDVLHGVSNQRISW